MCWVSCTSLEHVNVNELSVIDIVLADLFNVVVTPTNVWIPVLVDGIILRTFISNVLPVTFEIGTHFSLKGSEGLGYLCSVAWLSLAHVNTNDSLLSLTNWPSANAGLGVPVTVTVNIPTVPS